MDEVPELELSVTVRLLGPLEVAGTRGAVRLTGARQRAIVALLALRTPDVVSRSRLVAGLWGADPPPAAEQNLNRQLARIRLALAAVGLDGLLVTRDPGYALVLPAGSLDAGGFQAHLAAGRQAIEADYLATAAIELRVGLELWRGDPLSGCPVEDWGRAELARLREDLAGAIEALAETELRLGRPGRVADDLTRAVACQPGRERLWELLVIARHRAGQPAEALRAYRQARTALLDELGTEPGPRLRRLEMALLAGATELDPATAPPARAVRARPRPEPDEPACRQRQARLFLARLAQDARAEPGAGFAELRLATALRRYCRVPGHYREGGRWLRHALARSPAAPPELRVRALTAAAWLALAGCDYDRAAGHATEALDLTADNLGPRGRLLTLLGAVARERADYPTALGCFHAATVAFRAGGDHGGAAGASRLAGMTYWQAGDLDAAGDTLSASLVAHRDRGERRGVAACQAGLGAVALYRGDHAGAGRLLDQALDTFRDLELTAGTARALHLLGLVRLAEGDHRAAGELLQGGLALHRASGERSRQASVLAGLASVACATFDLAGAAVLLRQADEIRAAIATPVPAVEQAALAGVRRTLASADRIRAASGSAAR